MKTNTLLLLASLAVLALNTSAAQSQPETVVLPVYVVEAPRYLPAEQHLKASLNELRQQANVPTVIQPEFAALKSQVVQNPKLVQAGKGNATTRIAKS